MTLAPGARLGSYEILAVLGGGGMGEGIGFAVAEATGFLARFLETHPGASLGELGARLEG